MDDIASRVFNCRGFDVCTASAASFVVEVFVAVGDEMCAIDGLGESWITVMALPFSFLTPFGFFGEENISSMSSSD